MKVHIWCPRASASAVALRDALINNGTTCYKSRADLPHDAQMRRMLRRVVADDLWVNWGAPPGFIIGCKQLNAVKVYADKADQLIKLAEAGVPVPEVFTEPGEGRIGRSANHQGGNDLLRGGGHVYYTQKLNIDREFRIHVFNGLSIRAGMKVPRPDFCRRVDARYACDQCGYPHAEARFDGENQLLPHGPHPWVRSYDGGWKLDYGENSRRYITNTIRDAAKRAVTALKLDFGAVDVGLVAGRPVILEVNLAPGLDVGPSVDAYVRHILRCATR